MFCKVLCSVGNDTNFIKSIADDNPEGYILQVDLAYPNKLHNLQKDFPICPEHRKPPGSKLAKLMTTLHDNKHYTLHYRNLKQALEHGLVLEKVHKVLKFKQSAWLKPYIELNNRLRTLATSDFEKDLRKLMNNAVFGKCMECIRKHRICKLVSSYEGRYGAKNLIASPRYRNRTVFDDGDPPLMAIELKKSELIFNKPMYVGMAILDLSKTIMYDFHYNFMLPTMGVDKCKLMYTDTDSFIYELISDNIYEELIEKNLDKFDTSDYPSDNPYNIPRVNKKVLGLMKDEANGQIITHFVGLRSKMYSYKVQGGNVVKKSKGIKKCVVKNKIMFDDYVDCLKNWKQMTVTQNTIRSFAHDVYSIEQTKIALSPHDDKRKLLPSSFDTLPWGHHSISE